MIKKEQKFKESIKPAMVKGILKNLESIQKDHGVWSMHASTYVEELNLFFIVEYGNNPSKNNTNARVFVFDTKTLVLKGTV